MNKTEYLAAVVVDFDMGVADAQNKRGRGNVGGAYNAGYDGYFQKDAVKQAVGFVAEAGYDDGFAKKPKTVPVLPMTFASDSVVKDLTELYGDAYGVGLAEASGGGSTAKSTAGWWILGGLGVLAAFFGVKYVTGKKEGYVGRPALANPRRGAARRHTVRDPESLWEQIDDVDAKIGLAKERAEFLEDEGEDASDEWRDVEQLYVQRERLAGALYEENPRKGKAVAKHGGYRWGTTYETWDEESLEIGETDEKGWEYEYEDHGPYKSLADLLQDIPGHYWLEWSDSRPGPHSWITSDKTEDRDYFEKGKSTYYSLFIEHADGTPLTQSDVNFVDDKIFGERKRLSRRG